MEDVPGVADGDGGAQQRTSHGVRAGESDGTGLFTLKSVYLRITTRYGVAYSSNGHSGATSDEGGGLRAVGLVGSDNLRNDGDGSTGASRGESASSESDDGSSSKTHFD